MNYFRIRKDLIKLINIALNKEDIFEFKLLYNEDDFLRCAGKEGVLNYIYYYLVKNSRVLRISNENKKKIDEYFFLISALNIKIQETVKGFIKETRESGIGKYVFLKGIHLLSDIYQIPPLRPMGDVDILTAHESLEPIKKVLLKLGFSFSIDSSMGYNFKLGDSIIFDIIEFEGDFYIGDIRREISPINYEAVKDYIQTVELDNEKMTVLTPELCLLLFSDHFRKHFYNRLIWFVDFILLFKKYNVNLDSLVQLSRNFNLHKSLFYTIYLIDRYFPGHLNCSGLSMSSLEKIILEGIMEGKIVKGNSYLYFLSLKNPFSRFFLILRKIFPLRRDMSYIYDTKNEFKIFLLYYLRPVMILITFIKNIIRTKGIK